MPDLTMQDVLDKKQALTAEIFRLVNSFEESTKIKVDRVSLDHFKRDEFQDRILGSNFYILGRVTVDCSI